MSRQDSHPQKVFFDNFPGRLEQETLLGMFQRYATRGKILSSVIMHAGFYQYGMITFENSDDAKDCSRCLNGNHFPVWRDSQTYHTFTLRITFSGPTAEPYTSNDYFTPFRYSQGQGRKESNPGEEVGYPRKLSYGGRGPDMGEFAASQRSMRGRYF